MRINMSMSVVRFVAVLTGGLFLTGLASCSSNNLADQLVTGSISQLPKGYDCPINSNDLYPVGAVYRRDQNGVFYSVKDLSGHTIVKDHLRKNIKISDYEISDTQKTNAQASAALLKKAIPNLSLSGSAKKKKTLSVNVTVKDIRADDIDDEVEGNVVKWIKTNVGVKPGNRYFLVRQAVKASAVSYVIKKQDLAELGAKGDLSEIAKASANVTIRDNDGSLKLSQTFEPRITVCTKSADITALMPK
ncbi:MAG: hypothetical protein DHS20C07_08940 [Methyloligella sp.]|nr:MAG: hypothetical protein DHS20C07_08940 [Methyloligella sp.]